jgi:bifunctional non-homologous end joining protein LigD
MTAGRPGAGLLAAVLVTLIVFDVLRSGRDHLICSLYLLRRALLDNLGLQVCGIVQVPPAFPGDAAALLAATRDQGYEGIVLKQPASLYHPGRRTRDWLKIRNIHTIDVRVGGWLPAPAPVGTWPGLCSWASPSRAAWSSRAPSEAACPWQSCAT